MKGNFAKLAILVKNTVRMDEASKIIGNRDGSHTILSELTSLFAVVIDEELAHAAKASLAGITPDDRIEVEDSKFEVGKSNDGHTHWIDYIFMLTGNFPGVIKLRLTVCTAPDKIDFYMQTLAQDDSGKVIGENRIDENELCGIPLALPMAVSFMLDDCGKKAES